MLLTAKLLSSLKTLLPSHKRPLPSKVHEQLRIMIFHNAYVGISAAFFVIFGLILMDWTSANPTYPFEWAVGLFLIILLRLCVLVSSGKKEKGEAPSLKAYFIYYALSAIEGVGFGLSMFLVFPDDILHQTLLINCMIGMAVGGIPVFSGSFSLYALFAGSIMAIMELRLVMELETFTVLAVLNPVIFGVLLVISYRMSSLVISTLLFKHKNEQLASIEAASKNSIVEYTEKLGAKTVEVERVTERLKNLVNLISQDLRNQVVTLCQFAAYLTETPSTADEHDNVVKTVQKTAEKGLHLVDDLLNLTGVKVERPPLNLESRTLSGLIENALDRVWAMAEAKGVVVETLLEEQREVDVDPEKMEQVFMKLIGNAIRHTPSKGTVTVRTLATTQGLRVEVSDSGIGMDAAKMATLFDGSEVIDISRPENPVNLMLAQKIVQAHASLLEVSSNPDAGCCLAFTLPWSDRPITTPVA